MRAASAQEPGNETFVYVSSAGDGDIGAYRFADAGTLVAIGRVKAAPNVMPMAVDRDRRLLYAASRSQPYTVQVYAIEAGGALRPHATAPLAGSFAYIALDRTGRYLFGASYHGHFISVNAIDAEGHVAPEPLQVIAIERNPHSIRADATNRFVYVPALGTDRVYQFTFDAATGRLAPMSPPACELPAMTGPRHFVISRDNRFVYVLSEFRGTVTTLALDAASGRLTAVAAASALPPDTDLRPGAPRNAVPLAGEPPRNVDRDIWAADLHLTPDGRFLCVSERTSSIIGTLRVDETSGALAYSGCAATERQPRGFAVDPGGRFVVASGELSQTISVHAIDAANGTLCLVGRHPTGQGSSWVEIVSGSV